MNHLKQLFQQEFVRLPLGCITAFGGSYLLSAGTVCGIVSPLPAAIAGVCPPLYAFCMLCGTLLAYVVQGTPQDMAYLLTCLVAIVCVRILFYEVQRPNMLALLSVISCAAAGFITDLFFTQQGGRLPLYIMESLLIGAAAFLFADAWTAFCKRGRILLDAGKSFTFAMTYLLGITALCGLDLPFCNAGRTAGIVVTLLAAKQFRQNGGTLLGALTACGSVLCSVSLGMPLLFLPITAMLAGFLSRLPNALFLPVFFLMQTLSSAVLDSSMELARVITELLFAGCLYALCCHIPLCRIIVFEAQKSGNSHCTVQREQFLSKSIAGLREETASIIGHLHPTKPVDAVRKVRTQLCSGCKNEAFCWTQRRNQTEQAFSQLLHNPAVNPIPESLNGCIRQNKIAGCLWECGQRSALEQTASVHLTQNRNVMLEYFRLLEEMASDAAKQREITVCVQETESLQKILRQCRCEFRSCFVRRLKSGRYAAEIYAGAELPAAAAVQELLSDLLSTELCSIPVQREGGILRYCFFQKPAYQLEHTIRSVHAPGYKRCGDTAEAFTDVQGNQYLILSDGMGSGASASLMSQIAVRTFVRLVTGGMPPETAIRFANTILLSESNTESFATLDILRLNADNGEVQLYKSGASATLYLHHRQVMRIAAKSFPIGIVAQAEPFCRTLPALANDRIIMISDGISEAEYPFIKELLLSNMPLSQIAAQVCEKADVFHAGKAEDDITVIAAAVRSTAAMQEECSAQPVQLLTAADPASA